MTREQLEDWIPRLAAIEPEQRVALPGITPERTMQIVGGGIVAMDAARCSKRLGAEVYVVYRRGMEELPARREEVEHAEEEGIIFKTLCNPVEVDRKSVV